MKIWDNYSVGDKMTSQNNLDKFNKIYDETYSDVLKYIIIKCHDVNDANDIIQEVYLEFWKILNKKELVDSNIKSFLIGIAINKIKKHYTIIQRIKSILVSNKNEYDEMEKVKSNIDIEELIIKKDDWDNVWNYIKLKKNKDVARIFYLYYVLELSIKDISHELNVKESYIKNIIFRTIKELYSLFGKGCD